MDVLVHFLDRGKSGKISSSSSSQRSGIVFMGVFWRFWLAYITIARTRERWERSCIMRCFFSSNRALSLSLWWFPILLPDEKFSRSDFRKGLATIVGPRLAKGLAWKCNKVKHQEQLTASLSSMFFPFCQGGLLGRWRLPGSAPFGKPSQKL